MTAISVPELRIHKRKTYKHDVYKLACYIKNRKPSIDIHLLGCTEIGLLRNCNFCTSSDSTSYLSCSRYGTIAGYHVSQINRQFYQEKTVQAKKIIEDCSVRMTDSMLRLVTIEIIAAHILRTKYQQAAGPQD